MTLQNFLVGRTLESVDVLPDNRLINVYCDDGQCFGVVVDNVPPQAPLTNELVSQFDGVIISTVDGLSFDSSQYQMLSGETSDQSVPTQP